ncbi:MAG: hypothetical protein HQK69_03525, partial [Desulfamplus sp.]|nr:hypothetical protein [Desulfamplus sp.]
QISLFVTTGDTSEIIEAIVKGEVEAGIVGAEVNKGEYNTILKQEKLTEDEMKLIVPISHPFASKSCVDIESLLKEPFIGREKGSGTWKSISKSIANYLKESTDSSKLNVESGNCTCDKLNISVRLGSNSSVIQGILNGAGISIISTIAVQDYIDSGRLKALSVNGLNLKRHFFLTTHKKLTLSPLAMLFIDFIKNELQENIAI